MDFKRKEGKRMVDLFSTKSDISEPEKRSSKIVKPSSKIEKPQKAVSSGKKRKAACEEGSGNAVKKARFDPKSN